MVTGESAYRSQYTPCVREDEGLDERATFRVRKYVLLNTKEFPKIVTHRDGIEQVG